MSASRYVRTLGSRLDSLHRWLRCRNLPPAAFNLQSSIFNLQLLAAVAVSASLVSAQRGGAAGQAGAGQAGRGGAAAQGRGAGQGIDPTQGRGQQQPQQDVPQPVFRANVNAVQVDVRVVDKDGNFVRDLRADEFRVTEDNVGQTVTTFGLIDLPEFTDPGPMLAGNRVDPDVATNARSAEGRLYVIVMDDKPNQLSVAGLDTPEQWALLRNQNYKDLARDFVENHLGDADRAAVIATSGRKEIAQEFTNNRQRLLSAIDKFQMGFGAEQTRLEFAMPTGSPGAVGADGSRADTGVATQTIDTTRSAMYSLTALSKWLAQIPGRRKSIVLFSERMGSDSLSATSFTMNLESDEAADFRAFVEATARANVGLYIVDPIGVPGGRGARGVLVNDNPTGIGSEFDNMRRDGLMSLAESTGGFAITGSNDFTTGFDRIVEENSSYYMLGYSSSNARQDGKFRRLKVEVLRPGLTVRSRAGYFGRDPKPAKPPKLPAGVSVTLGEMLQSPLPVPGLTMRVAAPVFRDEKNMGSVGVIVEARGQDLQFLEQQSRFRGAIELVLTAIDPDGKQKAGEKGVVNMGLSSATRDAIAQNSVRLLSKMELKPGKYQLRVAAADAGTVGQQRGVVLYDLDVPDFSKAPLAMSGIAIASAVASRIPTTGTDHRWTNTLRAIPTSSREFAAADELRDYFEIYDTDTKSKHEIQVRTTVRSESGSREFNEELNLTSEFVGKDKTATLSHTTSIPLSTFDPGGYVLTVEVQNSANPAWVVSREVPFRVKR